MNTIRVSATKARNEFFELLNQVVLGTHVIIEKDKTEVAVISPTKKGTDLKGLIRASERARGIFKDYDVERDNPLRRKGAADFLGGWDKGLK